MLLQHHLVGIVEDMVDDVAVGVIDDVVGFPIVDPIDVEVVADEVVLDGLRGTELVDCQDVGPDMIQHHTNGFILVLRIVGGFVAIGPATLVVAIFEQVVLHHGDGFLCLQPQRKPQYEKNNKKTPHNDGIGKQK